jgi:hypothetical protein
VDGICVTHVGGQMYLQDFGWEAQREVLDIVGRITLR